MKIAPGIVAVVVALILLGSAFNDYREDTENTPARIAQGFRDMHNDAAFARDLKESEDRSSSEMYRSLAGAAFLVAGLALLAKSRSPESSETTSTTSLGL